MLLIRVLVALQLWISKTYLGTLQCVLLVQLCCLLVFDPLFSSSFFTFHSPHVVKYYGSYFKNTDLWIVMEYCGAGSVSDIIRLRNKTVRPFSFECMNGKYGCPAAQGSRVVWAWFSRCSMPDTTIGQNLRCGSFVPLKMRKLITLIEFWLSG